MLSRETPSASIIHTQDQTANEVFLSRRVADDAAAECEEGFVDLGAPVVAHEQSFELVRLPSLRPPEGMVLEYPAAADAVLVQ